MGPRSSRFGRILAAEARAYVSCALLAPGGARSVRERGREAPELGVLFVPGVGANASQFSRVKLALQDTAEWFDAFEYTSLSDPRSITRDLRAYIDRAAQRCARILLVGHSMGGLLSRVVLQQAEAPPAIVGFVSICSPLHGTWRSKLAPNPRLRAMAPDSGFIREVIDGAGRLDRLRGSVLAIGARHDQFITPFDSAFLDGHDRLCLDDTGHVASLFDPRVLEAITALAERLRERERERSAR